MIESFKHFVLTQPARFWMLVRLVVYLLVTYTAWAAGVDWEMLLAALAVILGIDLPTTEKTARSVYQPETVAQLVKKASFTPDLGNPWLSAVGTLALDIIRKYVSNVRVPEAMALIAPYVAEMAHRNLTPELREKIQTQVHRTLHNNDLIKKTTIPARVMALLGLAIVLSACAPAAAIISGGVGELSADGASITYTSEGALLDAGASAALVNIATVMGSGLTFYDEADLCEAVADYYRCLRAAVEPGAPWVIDLSGEGVSVLWSFERGTGSKHLVAP